VTYEITWTLAALDRAAGYLADDKVGISAVLNAVDDLESEPRSPATTGSTGTLRRLRVGRYRVVHEIDDEQPVVTSSISGGAADGIPHPARSDPAVDRDPRSARTRHGIGFGCGRLKQQASLSREAA
jgi:ParE toxin of type II toxin-antitoxin system, parDE